MKVTHPYGPLLRWATSVGRYYGLFIIGLLIVCWLSVILGFFPVIHALLSFAGVWLLRLTIATLALIASAIVFETFRY
jgi:hypothetical protein